jgi:oligosaccharide repeat unit polymerase
VELSSAKYFIQFVVIWLSLMLSLMAVIFCMPRTYYRELCHEIDIDESKLRKIIFITSGLSLLDYCATIWLVGGVESFLLSNWYQRVVELTSRLGDGYVVYSWLSQANQTIFTAAAALYTHCVMKRRKPNWSFHAFIVLFFLLHIAIQGDRIFFALYLLSILTSSWLYGRKKPIAALLMIAPVFALVFSAWAYFRNNIAQIGENISVYADQDLGNRAVVYLMDACEGSDTVILFHIINDFGQGYHYMYGSSYARVFFFLLPRKIFPEKPPGFAIQLANIYEPGETTSLAATQLGELYANFGVLSVVLLPLITVLTFVLSDELAQSIEKNILLSVVVFLVSIWSVRATFEDNFITFLVSMCLIWALRLEQGLCSKGPTIKVLVTAS